MKQKKGTVNRKFGMPVKNRYLRCRQKYTCILRHQEGIRTEFFLDPNANFASLVQRKVKKDSQEFLSALSPFLGGKNSFFKKVVTD